MNITSSYIKNNQQYTSDLKEKEDNLLKNFLQEIVQRNKRYNLYIKDVNYLESSESVVELCSKLIKESILLYKEIQSLNNSLSNIKDCINYNKNSNSFVNNENNNMKAFNANNLKNKINKTNYINKNKNNLNDNNASLNYSFSKYNNEINNTSNKDYLNNYDIKMIVNCCYEIEKNLYNTNTNLKDKIIVDKKSELLNNNNNNNNLNSRINMSSKNKKFKNLKNNSNEYTELLNNCIEDISKNKIDNLYPQNYKPINNAKSNFIDYLNENKLLNNYKNNLEEIINSINSDCKYYNELMFIWKDINYKKLDFITLEHNFNLLSFITRVKDRFILKLENKLLSKENNTNNNDLLKLISEKELYRNNYIEANYNVYLKEQELIKINNLKDENIKLKKENNYFKYKKLHKNIFDFNKIINELKN